NRGGKIGFRAIGPLRDSVQVDPPELNGNATVLRHGFRRMLTAAGLFPKEAAAMIATWDDSWFEEGSRVLYILPRPTVEPALPLAIEPAPSRIERVFVGRVELPAPTSRKEILEAVRNQDRAAIARYSRFFMAFWEEMKRNNLTGKMADPWSLVTSENAGCAK